MQSMSVQRLARPVGVTRSHSRALPQRAVFPRASLAADVGGASTSTIVAAPPQAGLVEINQDNFFVTLEAAGEKLVVVDFFTDWCGPCKLIYPELVKMSHEFTDVEFYKFNCNARNKTLGKQLKIRVAPTFHLYKKSEKIAEMTGARIEKLRSLVEEHM